MQLNSMDTYIEARVTWLTAVSAESEPFHFFSEHVLLEVGWKVLLHNEVPSQYLAFERECLQYQRLFNAT